MAPELVAYLFRECQPLFKHGAGSIVVALASEGDPVTEKTAQERYQQVVLARDPQALGLELCRFDVLSLPVLEQPGGA